MSKSFSKDSPLFSYSIKCIFCRLLRGTLHRSVTKREVASVLRGRGRPAPHLGMPAPHLGMPASREERALWKAALCLLPTLVHPTTDSLRSKKRWGVCSDIVSSQKLLLTSHAAYPPSLGRSTPSVLPCPSHSAVVVAASLASKS